MKMKKIEFQCATSSKRSTIVFVFFAWSLIISCFTIRCYAQDGEVTLDSLDWKMYFPLEVGNSWEYQDGDGLPLTRLSVTSLTEANGQEYFVMHEEVFHIVFPSEVLSTIRDENYFVRYDTSGVVLWFQDLALDVYPYSSTFRLGDAEFINFDLRASFGHIWNWGPQSFEKVAVTGGYNDNIRMGAFYTLDVEARKSYNYLVKYHSYAWGIGFMGGGNLYGPRLKYAYVSGQAYGAKVVSSDHRPSIPPDLGIIDVYPSPADGVINLDWKDQTSRDYNIKLFDAMGRLVYIRDHVRGRMRIDSSALRSGVYFILIETSRTKIFKPIVVKHLASN